MIRKENLKHYIFLHLVLLFYAAGGIISKIAGGYDIFSVEFILLYFFKLFTLAIYAVLWQQVLKHFELTTAFANKAVTVIWGLVFGVLFFQEELTWKKLLGSFIIMAGIWVAVRDDE